MPISLYLQKYAGIAPALLTNTLTSFSFHSNNYNTVAGHWCAFSDASPFSNHTTASNTSNMNAKINNNSFDFKYNTNTSSQSTEHSESMDHSKGAMTSHNMHMEDEFFANDLLFNDPHDLTNSFASA